ncbi:aminoglycoside phosphotransferase family protein [Actinoallomurus spadix]|uniref:Aminoglycoside phosphotransferase family protein n=1 Tax=Actinoallomurus spadix TaxID=79912 RepID=A0ABN0WAH5_9ACTN|nr:aminoglycoside phosphotransferase family protein [Actinoallomurus spadix]MCO5988603.1 aminoglycoside phosphotransferase family protein [Actinoallomurus spadix]
MHARPLTPPEDGNFEARSTDALRAACAAAQVSTLGARLIRLFASAVYHLPEAGAVARVARATSPRTIDTAARALSVTKWLAATYDFPTVTPLIDEPLQAHDCVVTFWNYLPQEGEPPTAADLGRLLRQLHSLPLPELPLRRYQPLRSVRRAAELSCAITESERSWLLDRCRRLIADYECLDFSLPPGMIHGDAWRGNVLRDGARVVLSDWDSVSWGPREMDLVPTLAAVRFGLPEADRDAFIAAYGHDITTWSGYSVLKDIRELSTLTALLRNAHADEESLRELRRRLRSIRTGDDQRWVTF